MKSKRVGKSAKAEQGLLLSVARTIGSTLGTLAAKTGGESKHSIRPARVKKTKPNAAKTRIRHRA
jgi:hypothetical protein